MYRHVCKIFLLSSLLIVSALPAFATKSSRDNELVDKYINKLNVDKMQKYGPFVNDKLLFPTVIQNTSGEVLGLAYSTKESLREALTQKKGIYYSRSRDSLWVKSPSGRNSQSLIDVRFNCDGTALLFTVIQHGVFCHENVMTCFNASLNQELSTYNPMPKLKIGVSKGARQNQLAYDLLAELGIGIYKNKLSRDTSVIVKTSLYPNIDVVDVRHHDIGTLLDIGYVDIAIAYDNVAPANVEKNYIKLKKEGGIKNVKVVAIYNKNKIFPKNPVIFTEYPNLSNEWSKKNFPNSKVVTVHGGVERYLKDGLCDLAVVVVDSGKTLKSHNLDIYGMIADADLSIYFSKATLKKHFSFFRKIMNKLQSKNIYFFDVDDIDNGYLSNFYPAPFVTNEQGKKETWKTSEHYYHARKFNVSSKTYQIIRSVNTAKEAYKIAHQHEGKVRKNWNDIKEQVMLKALTYKFNQNPKLKEMLLGTKDKKLCEHSIDNYWGTGLDGQGQNRLGHLLALVRKQLS